MPVVIGVKFRRHGPLNYYAPEQQDYALGDRVVADTARGPEIGEVVLPPSEVDAALLPVEVRPVIRRATEEDLERRRSLEERAPEQIQVAKERAEQLGLEMKVFAATTSFDEGRILFDFTSENTLSVTELARELAASFHCRVEMRQVYPRDEARIQDGYGPCGRRLCCSSWLKEFQPVSIKHAKEQGLPLNPSKLNGMCGKLKCCLTYENEQYVEAKASLPRPGETVELPEGSGTVREISVPRDEVMVDMSESGALVAVAAERLRLDTPRAPGPPGSGGRRRRRRRGGAPA